MEDFEQYLRPTKFFDFDKPKVKNKALEITKGLETDKEKAIALFYWVRDEIKFNGTSYYLTKSTFKASTNLRRKYGSCLAKSTLLATFARTVGIPSKIHIVDIINHKTPQRIVDYMLNKAFYCHGYAELYLNGKWIKVGPIFDKETAEKGGFLPHVEFNGKDDALFAQYDESGNLFVEYIGDRGVHADLPYNLIDQVVHEKYAAAIERGFKFDPNKNKNESKKKLE